MTWPSWSSALKKTEAMGEESFCLLGFSHSHKTHNGMSEKVSVLISVWLLIRIWDLRVTKKTSLSKTGKIQKGNVQNLQKHRFRPWRPMVLLGWWWRSSRWQLVAVPRVLVPMDVVRNRILVRIHRTLCIRIPIGHCKSSLRLCFFVFSDLPGKSHEGGKKHKKEVELHVLTVARPIFKKTLGLK